MASDRNDPPQPGGGNASTPEPSTVEAALAPTALPDETHGSLYHDAGGPPGAAAVRSDAERSYVEQIAAARAAGEGRAPTADPFAKTDLSLPAATPTAQPHTHPGLPAQAPPSAGDATLPAAGPGTSSPTATSPGVPSAPSRPRSPTAVPASTLPRPPGARSGWFFLAGLSAVLVVVLALAALVVVVVRLRSGPSASADGSDQAGVLEEMTERELLRRVRAAGWSPVEDEIRRFDSESSHNLIIPADHRRHGRGTVNLVRWKDAQTARDMVDAIRSRRPGAAVRREGRAVLAVLVIGRPRVSRELLRVLAR